MGRLVFAAVLFLGLCALHTAAENEAASMPRRLLAAGAELNDLLADINAVAARSPRVGSASVISTAADGAPQAQRRTAAAELQTLPLRATGQASGGAVAPRGTLLNGRSASVAKRIVDDNGNSGSNFGSAGSTKGVTTTSGARPAASLTTGSSSTTAGEKATSAVSGLARDGSAATSVTRQQGLGDRVVTQLQSASLTATAPEDDPAARFSGAYNRAIAESNDDPALSATADLGLASNTDALLTATSTANRYGYTKARPSARVRSDNTESGRVQINAVDFGTGFLFGDSTGQSSTFLEG